MWRSKVDIECLSRMQISVIVLPLLELLDYTRSDTVMQKRILFPKEKRQRSVEESLILFLMMYSDDKSLNFGVKQDPSYRNDVQVYIKLDNT